MTVQYQLRRIAVFAVIAALLIGAFSVMAVAMPSDVNGDGELSTADTRVLLLSLTGAVTLTEEQRLAADANGDGEITSSDARAMLVDVLASDVSTTRPLTTTTGTNITTKPSTTYPPTTTTTRYDCVSTFTTTTTLSPTTTTTWVLTGPDGTAPTTYPTTTNTTLPNCVTTYTTTTIPPTTVPYGSFTLTADTVSAHGGDTITVPIRVSRDHALVGFEMEVLYSPLLTLQAVNNDVCNPYATRLNTAVFNDDAQWRVTKVRNGVLNIRYVSSAKEGSLDSGVLLALTFSVVHVSYEYEAYVDCYMTDYVCAAYGIDYVPYIYTVSGTVQISPGTTVETTTTTTTTTNTTSPDCVSNTTYPTTLPYGDPLCFTGETVTARVGSTFEWSVDVSARHSLVALEMDIYYDSGALTWIPDGTSLNETIFAGNAQWRISNVRDGLITLRYVSGADTGDAAGGELLTFTFQLNPDLDVTIDDIWIRLSPTSTLSAVNGYTYQANDGTITDGHIKVASRTTRPKTTTTTECVTTCTTTTTTFVYDQ